MEERREEPRFRLNCPVAVEWDNRILNGEVTDVGRHSVSVNVEPSPPAHTVLRLVISTSGQAVNLLCVVKRTGPNGFAAEFDVVPPLYDRMLGPFLSGQR